MRRSIDPEDIRPPDVAVSAGLRPYRARGNGPLLVYVSGLDGTGELLFKQSEALAAAFRVVTFRQRDDGDFTYDDLADDPERVACAIFA